jgi:hypothetical protein
MKKISKSSKIVNDDLEAEYEIDYTTTKRNPYFNRDRVFIEIDKELADVYKNSENINNVLRAFANSFSKNSAAVL